MGLLGRAHLNCMGDPSIFKQGSVSRVLVFRGTSHAMSREITGLI